VPSAEQATAPATVVNVSNPNKIARIDKSPEKSADVLPHLNPARHGIHRNPPAAEACDAPCPSSADLFDWRQLARMAF